MAKEGAASGTLSQIPMDEALGVLMPVAVYWLYSGFYSVLEICTPKLFEKSRLHSRAEEQKNLVSRTQVVWGVLFQQLLQIITAVLLFVVDPFKQESPVQPSLWVQARQLAVGMVVMDSWQYLLHRLMHEVRFLYRNLHSWHHRLLVPYAYGALYNHPLEGLLLDTFGGAIAFVISGMTPRTAVFFFTFATMKTVDDHCGVFLPFNPLQFCFKNNSAYHDVHHQTGGFRFNYSQPFFPFWDYVLGTYMPYNVVKRAGGGLEARLLPAKKKAAAAKEEEPSKDLPPLVTKHSCVSPAVTSAVERMPKKVR